ncbi:MAG TPA: hypothetical protein VG872_12115 [Acidimicrobiia bacterium]|jgi:hypothetical protein|nr:hypothetical protein [Acidimicrobiia bacterium]
MPRLDWTRIDEGWVAGRYHIERAAPDLWVCSRLDLGFPRIELTSNSLRDLQRRIAQLEARRRMIPRAVVYFLVMLMAAALALWAARWTAETGPLVVIAATSVAMFALIGTIDALVSLHWEPPRRI